jgi:hypothetical protein
MGSSPGFGSTPCDSILRPVRTRFRCGSGCHSLSLATKSNSLGHSSRGTPSHTPSPHTPRKACGADMETVLRLLVGIRFQVLFHSPSWGTFHLSLAVLVHYRSPKVFSLGAWTPQIRTGLACPVLLRYSTRGRKLSHTGLSPSVVGRSRTVLLVSHLLTLIRRALLPRPVNETVWAAPRSLATTSGMISLPRTTEMFQFVRCPPPGLWIQPGGLPSSSGGVPPFGNRRISACRRLPDAYRSLPRPSSAFGAKASTIRPV